MNFTIRIKISTLMKTVTRLKSPATKLYKESKKLVRSVSNGVKDVTRQTINKPKRLVKRLSVIVRRIARCATHIATIGVILVATYYSMIDEDVDTSKEPDDVRYQSSYRVARGRVGALSPSY